LVTENERLQIQDEAGGPATLDAGIIGLPLAYSANEATGERREEKVQSHPAARSAASNGASRHSPLAQSDGNFEPLLDVIEAAKLLRIHPKTLRDKACRGTIPAVQIGRIWRFRVSTLNRWLEKIAS
jgi:excisionase family DNA binding protein